MESFESLDEYHGDIILIERLSEFYTSEYWNWNDGDYITLEDISNAVSNNFPEISDPFGDTYKHPAQEIRDRKWHIGRIIYFINHPEEIQDIEIDNMCNNGWILPVPVIVDGHHRFVAAKYLHDNRKLKTIHCMYGGRMDVLDYLKGNTDELLEEII